MKANNPVDLKVSPKNRPKNPVILKVFPTSYPDCADYWSNPKSLGVSLVSTFSPEKSGTKGFKYSDCRIYEEEIQSLIEPKVDAIIGFGLGCWDLNALYEVINYQLPSHVQVIDLSLDIAQGEVWTVLGEDENDHSYRSTHYPLVRILPYTLGDKRIRKLCDYRKITEDWTSNDMDSMANALLKTKGLSHSLWELYQFIDKHGYVLVRSYQKNNRLDQIKVELSVRSVEYEGRTEK